MTAQSAFEVTTRGRGLYEITAKIAEAVRGSNVACGLVHVFMQHTSCSVIITENADPSVQRDLETLASRWAPDGDASYEHDAEGEDDMPAHARSVLAGPCVTIPVAERRMLLGTWQGVFLWEHRSRPHARRVVVTVMG